MRKKIVIITTLIFIFAMTCTFLVACNGRGATGKSAYELAVEQGFQGSLDDWLESLKGTNGQNGIDGKDGNDGAVTIQEIYEKAREAGFKGDYLEFLQSYLNLDEDIQVASYIALRSAVKVQAKGIASSGWSTQNLTSNGSGVIYKLNECGDAYIITNYHVVYNSKFSTSDRISDNIIVFLYGYESDAQAITAKYIGGAKDYDIAILKVSGSNIIKNSGAKEVGVASSKDVAVGSTAIAVGCPASGGNTDHNFSATKGIVSVDSENISVSENGYSIQSLRVLRIDAAINSGNSGGGLFNARGQLIGIVNAKSGATGIDNIGYAIPSDVATGIADYAIAHCDGENNKNIKKLHLGIEGVANSSKAVYDDTTKTVKVVEEVAIASIESNSLAIGNDLQVGDVLNAVEFDGVKYDITRIFSLADALWKVKDSTEQLKFYITRGTDERTTIISINADNFRTLN